MISTLRSSRCHVLLPRGIGMLLEHGWTHPDERHAWQMAHHLLTSEIAPWSGDKRASALRDNIYICGFVWKWAIPPNTSNYHNGQFYWEKLDNDRDMRAMQQPSVTNGFCNVASRSQDQRSSAQLIPSYGEIFLQVSSSPFQLPLTFPSGNQTWLARKSTINDINNV